MKTLLKKSTAILLIIMMLFSVTGCGTTTSNANNETMYRTDDKSNSIIEEITNLETAGTADTDATNEGIIEESDYASAVTDSTSDLAGLAAGTSAVIEIAGNTGSPISNTNTSTSASSPVANTPTTDTVVNAGFNAVASAIAAAEVAATSTSVSSTTTTVASTAANASESTVAVSLLANNNTITRSSADQRYLDYMVTNYNFSYVESLSQITALFSKALDGQYDETQDCYIRLIAPEGSFDTVAESMDTLHIATLDYNGETTTAVNPFLQEMSYVQNTFGFKYQEYITDGINCILLVKLANPTHGLSYYEIIAIPDSSSSEMDKARAKAKEIAAIYNYGTVFDKIKNVHDYMCNTVVYDDSLVKDDIHTAYGSLVNGVAVCDGYAEGYKMILDELGIACNVVVNFNHEWNEVKLDGKWYFVDCTNDDYPSGTIGYSFFLNGQDILNSSVSMAIVVSDGKYTYYSIFSTDRIYYFGYGRNANSTVNTLATASYNKQVIVKP